MPPSRMDQGLDQTAQQDTSPEKNAAANAAPRFYHFSDIGVLIACCRANAMSMHHVRRRCVARLELARVRSDVWLVVLDPAQGSEIRKPRPCVVVSPDEMNRPSAPRRNQFT